MNKIKKEFIINYATNFLSSYAATNYTDFCSRYQHNLFVENAPIEDAFFLAKEMFENEMFQEKLKNLDNE